VRLRDVKEIAISLSRDVVRVRISDAGSVRCVEILWRDGSTSLIPVSLFRGREDERKAFRKELEEIIRIRRHLEERESGFLEERLGGR